MKVMLALDEFQHSEAALRSVSKRDWPEGTEINLLSVIDLGLYDQDGWSTETMIELNSVNKYLVARRNQYLDLHEMRLRRDNPGLKLKKTVLQGRARESILKAIRVDEPDLLIMGTHGRKGPKRFILGSVAESVLVESLCPCEIVKTDSYEVLNQPIDQSTPIVLEEQTPAFKVLICIQDQKCVDYLGDFVVDYTLPEQVEFKLMHTSSSVGNYNFIDLDGAAESLVCQISQERWRLGKKYLDTFSKKLGLVSRFTNIEEYLVEGDPRYLIVEQIIRWKPDLVILGSHAKKGIVSLGSVSRHVITASESSVLVVPLLNKMEKQHLLNQERKLHIIV